MDLTTALLTLSALSNETRLWIFRLLVQAGPSGMSAGDIADSLSSPQNTVSNHLKQLSQAGLIARKRLGRSLIYSANFTIVRELVLFLMQDCCAGQREVCAPVAAALGNP